MMATAPALDAPSTPRRRKTDKLMYRLRRRGPLIAFLFIAAVFTYIAWQDNRESKAIKAIALRATCDELQHRVAQRTSDRDGLRAIRANGLVLTRLARESFEGRIEASRQTHRWAEAKRNAALLKVVKDAREDVHRIHIPPPPEPELIAARNKACKAAGVKPEPDPRKKGELPR